jgi:integrase
MTARTDYLYRRTVKGREYLYFRNPATKKLTPLPLDQTSVEFRRQYDLCIKALRAARKPAKPAPLGAPANERVAFLPSTMGAAVEVYLRSCGFEKKRPGTQYNYRRCLDYMRDKLGRYDLCTVDTDVVDAYSEEVAQVRGDAVADMHVALISNIWKTVKKLPQFGIRKLGNPTIEAEQHYEKPRRPNRPWSQETQDLFMASAPDRLKLAKLLLHFSAQRGGDCVKMLWTDFDGKGLYVRPEKDEGEAMEQANYHLCPKPLLDALLAAPRLADTILVNAWGKPYGSTATLSHAIRREFIKLGLAKRGDGKKLFTMHGLRKTAASEVAGLLVAPRASSR